MNLAASTLATSGSPPPFLRQRIRVPLLVPLRGGDGAAAGASEPSAPADARSDGAAAENRGAAPSRRASERALSDALRQRPAMPVEPR